MLKGNIDQAISFAREKHSGQKRKGSDTPYIVHPMEVKEILECMHADEALIIAGVLHDTVEDTDATVGEIEERFGPEVASIVAANSEDKSRPWQERKQHTIDVLRTAPRDVQLLILADKISNMRSMARDHALIGDELWKRFKAPKEKQAWYYAGIIDSLKGLASDADASGYYTELCVIYAEIFGEL